MLSRMLAMINCVKNVLKATELEIPNCSIRNTATVSLIPIPLIVSGIIVLRVTAGKKRTACSGGGLPLKAPSRRNVWQYKKMK